MIAITRRKPAADAPSAREVFQRCYAMIRRICERARDPGIAVVAADANGVAGVRVIAASPLSPKLAVLGRHAGADLRLPDVGVAHRQVLLVVHPLRGSSEPTVHLIDLRSTRGLEDETGRSLSALVAEGPIFVRCGRYWIFCLATGDGLPWPDDACDGWHCIPERVYRREQLACSLADVPLQSCEPPLGELSIASDEGRLHVALRSAEVDHGFLIGRSRRCDLGGFADPRVSRMHLMILRVGARLSAIDLASAHGTFTARGERKRIVELSHDITLDLGGAVRLQWSDEATQRSGGEHAS